MNRRRQETTIGSLPERGERDFQSYYHSNRLERQDPYCGTFRHAPQDIVPVEKNSTRLFEKRELDATRHLNSEDLKQILSFDYDETVELPDESDGTCAICLETFHYATQLRALSCGHWFHQKCIDIWFVGHGSRQHCHTNRCPTCNEKPRPNATESIGRTQVSEIPAIAYFRVGAALLEKEQRVVKSSAAENGLELMMKLLDATASEEVEETETEEDEEEDETLIGCFVIDIE